MYFRVKRSAEGGLRRRKRASIKKKKGSKGKSSGKKSKNKKKKKGKKRGKKPGKGKKKGKKGKKKKKKSKGKSGSKSSERSGGSGLDQEVILKHTLLYFLCLANFKLLSPF